MVKMEENKIDLGNLKTDQLGYVFRDIEKQARIMENTFNIPKFTFMPELKTHITYRGKETDVTYKMAFSRNFNLQIELIQLLEGEWIYKEFLEQGKEGLHHIAIFVDGFGSLESYIDQFKNAGYDIIQAGAIGKQAYAYFDTEKSLGILLELEETIKRKRKK